MKNIFKSRYNQVITKTHVVVKGDTLTGIALKYGKEVKDLTKLNKLHNIDVIFCGQILIVEKFDYKKGIETNLFQKFIDVKVEESKKGE